MIQSESEAAEDFILRVKLQAESCEFGAFKETAIRDKLVMGVQDKQIQQRLIEEEDLTLAKAEKLIVNRESAGVRTRMMNGNNLTVVAKIDDNKRKVYSSSRSRSKERRIQIPSTSDYFKRLREDPKDDDSESEENCMKITSVNRRNEPCFVKPIVEQVEMRMEVDCGSAVSVIEERDFLDYFGNLSLERYLLVVVCYPHTGNNFDWWRTVLIGILSRCCSIGTRRIVNMTQTQPAQPMQNKSSQKKKIFTVLLRNHAFTVHPSNLLPYL
ncbi:AAEL003068-PA [Aedes aegypti]|uniref:AAEL003068-PA n=1 Tax=Aedes aegypti TaxID=7159 RepID=Q0IG67_AEDAE|nr:AAEL003068-PA [Aedes aegypti]